jgi:hypothetical protein
MRRAARTLAWASTPGTAMERDLDPYRTLLWGVLLSLIACASDAATPPAPLDVTAFREAILAQHNRYRALHGVPPLVLSPPLHATAQHHAAQLARTNRLVHSHQLQVGENLALFRSSRHEPPPPAAVVERWYREIKNYHFTQPGFQARTGHFTQVVWKASQALGIGMAQAGDGTWYLVGHYSPPGNITGHFPANVLPPTP